MPLLVEQVKSAFSFILKTHFFYHACEVFPPFLLALLCENKSFILYIRSKETNNNQAVRNLRTYEMHKHEKQQIYYMYLPILTFIVHCIYF